jgi:serine/threonine protein phosphatase PrpC
LSFLGGDVLAGDTFLLASDGLTRLVTEAELQAGLAGVDIGAAADRFIELTLARGAPDNVSLAIVRASWLAAALRFLERADQRATAAR